MGSKHPRASYGADVGEGRTVIVRAERSRGTVRFRTVWEGGPREEAVTGVAELTSVQAEILAGDAVLAVNAPAGRSFTRWLQTPFASEAKARKVLPSLLDVQIPFPLESCVYAFPVVDAGAGQGVLALAAGGRLEDLQIQLQATRALGLDPHILDLETLALWDRALAETAGSGSTHIVVAYLGRERSCLAIGSPDGFIGGFSLPGVTAGEGAPFESLATRLRHLLQSQLPRNDTPTAWVWAGPGSGDTVVAGALEKRVAEWGRYAFRTAEEPATFLARALAARALGTGRAPCNLRMGPLAHPAMARDQSRRIRDTALACGAAGLLLCAANLGWMGLLRAREGAVERETSRRAHEITGMRAGSVPPGQELRVVQRSAAERQGRLAPLRRLGAREVSGLIETVLREAGGLSLTIGGISAKPGMYSVRGTAAGGQALEAFVQRLEALPYKVAVAQEEAGEGIRYVIRGGQAP